MKPRVKLLVAVWGGGYIDAFTRLALPSLLAPGNLPALAADTDLQVCILTSAKDQPLFEAKPAFQALRALCPVRFTAIDDLLGSSVYGITLTLAYMRGIAAEGEDMVNVHFVFFNSDFILAAGSLRSLLAQILAGRRAVLAPSFRAVAEDLAPVLEARVDPSRSVLAVPPRELVGLALRHPHATILAKTLSQDAFRSLYQNQLYWRVDEHTMLGRFYLMFMLCLRPERVVWTANTYCDYGFVPEFCPSGDLAFLRDSDEFFMLETQARHHEAAHIRLGPHRLADIAGYLSEWTTREHRRYAHEDLVFHAGDIPPAITAASAQAKATVAELESLLPAARPHALHAYWVGSLPLWTTEIERRGGNPSPAELERVAAAPVRLTVLGRLFGLARGIVRGTPDELRPWHAGWLDQRLAENARREAGRDDVLASLTPEQMLIEGEALWTRLLTEVRAGGLLRLVVRDPAGEFAPAAVAGPLMSLAAVAGTGAARIEFSDGGLQRRIRLAVRRLGQLYMRLGWPWMPVLALAGAALLGCNVLNNALGALRGTRADQPEYCGTILITVRKG